MKKTWIIIFTIIVFMVLYMYEFFLTKDEVIGYYINVNYENEVCADMPHISDTLQLLKDGSFFSNYYGKGEYYLSHSFRGTEIQLKYSYSFGKAGITSHIERSLGSTKIILNRDLNHYYKRIK